MTTPALRRQILTVGAAAAGVSATVAHAAEPIPSDAIVNARDKVFARPEFARLLEPDEPSALVSALGKFANWLWEMQQAYPLVFWSVFVLLLLLALLLLAHVLWTIRVAGRTDFAAAELALEDAVRRADPAPFRKRAVELAEAGDLEGAVRALYTALLLTLDRKGTLRFARHKALLDYRIECDSETEARATLDFFAGTYHPGSFGRRPPTREQFDRLLGALDGVAT